MYQEISQMLREIEMRWFPEPTTIKWKQVDNYEEILINDKVVGSLEKRPSYCDRGHWYVKCFLATIDNADSFPRYYMSKEVAKSETEAWLRWRLWGNKGSDPK